MNHAVEVWSVVVLALVAANLPFVNERLFVVGPSRSVKGLGWRLLELAVFGGIVLLVGFLVEGGIGQRQEQRWEFYAAAGCLFLTFAFPGFVWRYLRRRPGAAEAQA